MYEHLESGLFARPPNGDSLFSFYTQLYNRVGVDLVCRHWGMHVRREGGLGNHPVRSHAVGRRVESGERERDRTQMRNHNARISDHGSTLVFNTEPLNITIADLDISWLGIC